MQVDDSQYMPAGSACTHDESDETLYAAEHEFGSFPHEDGYGVSSHLGYDSEDYEAYMVRGGAPIGLSVCLVRAPIAHSIGPHEAGAHRTYIVCLTCCIALLMMCTEQMACSVMQW